MKPAYTIFITVSDRTRAARAKLRGPARHRQQPVHEQHQPGRSKAGERVKESPGCSDILYIPRCGDRVASAYTKNRCSGRSFPSHRNAWARARMGRRSRALPLRCRRGRRAAGRWSATAVSGKVRRRACDRRRHTHQVCQNSDGVISSAKTSRNSLPRVGVLSRRAARARRGRRRSCRASCRTTSSSSAPSARCSPAITTRRDAPWRCCACSSSLPEI